jgi:hypothetical protein
MFDSAGRKMRILHKCNMSEPLLELHQASLFFTHDGSSTAHRKRIRGPYWKAIPLMANLNSDALLSSPLPELKPTKHACVYRC